MSELIHCSASRLRELLLAKETTPSEVADAFLKQIQKRDGEIHAWAYVDEEVVRRQLAKIEQLDPMAHPMWGIPVGVKDVFNTFDMPTEMGSNIWKDFTPGNDARMVHYLRRNGALMLGKTVTAEFAVHHQEETRNPYDLTRSPGTSSSGSAAAVAADMTPVALGTQTGGSIGRPASYCGVYGFKPSFGVLPRIGVLKTTDSLDTMGFFTKSAGDLKMVFDAARVHGENYEFVHRYIDNYQPLTGRKYRIGILEHPKWSDAGYFEKQAFHEWAKTLNTEDLSIDHLDCPDSFSEIYDLHATIYDKSLAYYFKDELPQKEQMSPRFRAMIDHGDSIDVNAFQNAVSMQARFAKEFGEWMRDYDLILTLGAAGEAPVGLLSDELPDSNLIWTFLGVPALSMPLLKGRDGLPVGVLAIAKKYDDMLLLDIVEKIVAQYQNQ